MLRSLTIAGAPETLCAFQLRCNIKLLRRINFVLRFVHFHAKISFLYHFVPCCWYYVVFLQLVRAVIFASQHFSCVSFRLKPTLLADIGRGNAA